jgi:SAM-dependent methyltransferase
MRNPGEIRSSSRLRKRFVRAFWATHNDSPAVRRSIRGFLGDLGDGRGLHLGCGDVRLDPRMVDLDLIRTPVVDALGDAAALPFAGDVFHLVVTQEMVEHVKDPFLAVREMARVLRRGGRLFLQAPFVIGYHPGPEDYWRFSRAGMIRLVEQAGLECRQVKIAVGPGTGFYRIAVEFAAGMVARIVPGLYIPVKGICSMLLFPVKWLDPILGGGVQADRISGGYFVVAVKP